MFLFVVILSIVKLFALLLVAIMLHTKIVSNFVSNDLTKTKKSFDSFKQCLSFPYCSLVLNILTDAVTTSLLRYSLTDDLANLDPLHVPLTQAIPTTPPWLFW